ncbi:glucoamylase family protein, partial [Paraburkholderia sp. SIMBA_009]
ALSSMPFMPLRSQQAALRFLQWRDGALIGRFGLMDAFQPSTGWVSRTHLAINQGPVVAMMENHRTGLIWDLFMNAPEVKNGLARLGFYQDS